jgi:hypothetical protein
MKRLGDNSFFHFFDRMVLSHDPTLELDRWSVDSVTWTRERHSFTGQTHSFIMEVFTGIYPGHGGWSLMVVQEHWWNGTQKRSHRWVLLTSGHRADAMAWLKKQEKSFKQIDHKSN